MHRFFSDPSLVQGGYIALDKETLAHLRVLRLTPQEIFAVCNGAGLDYHCILDDDRAKILSSEKNMAEPTVRATVYLAFTRGERMEWAIQKSVELGAYAICLFPAARAVVKYDEKGLSKKQIRWQKIAEEAAKQSGRGQIPQICAMSHYKVAMEKAANADLALFFYENERKRKLSCVLGERSQYKTVSLVIGPEGGFTEDEVQVASELGLTSVSLGQRILRCETAPVAALAALLYATGEL